MLKWIRWWGLVVLAALALLIWLISAVAVKPVLEWVGSKAVGAEVSMNSARLHWFPLGVRIEGLQVTNPDNLERYWVEAGKLDGSLDTFRLMRHQYVADEIAVTGLRFNTPRPLSAVAAEKARKKEQEKDGGFSFAIPGVDLPDVNALVDAQIQAAKAELDQLEIEFKAIEERWKTSVDALPDKDRVKEYKARIKEAKKGSVLQQLATLKSVKDDVDSDLKAIKTMRRNLDKDIAKVKSDYESAKQLPQRQMQLALQNLGIDTGDLALAKQLLLSYVMPLIEKMRESNTEESAEPSAPPRGEGRWIEFAETDIYPQVLVRKVLVDGEFTLTETPLSFSGEISDIANQPERWRNPMRVALAGKDQKLGSMTINGLFDHRQPLTKDQLSVVADKLRVANRSIADSDALQWLLNTGLVNVQADLSLTGDQLGGKLDGQFDQLDFSATAVSDKKVAKIMATAIETIKQFSINAKLGGTLSDPSFNVKSNLDRLLGDTLKAQLKTELEPYRAKVQSEIASRLNGPIAELDQYKDMLGGYDKLVDERKQELEDAIKKI